MNKKHVWVLEWKNKDNGLWLLSAGMRLFLTKKSAQEVSDSCLDPKRYRIAKYERVEK